jgi:16S rRNA G966 N2-methylase RsmD
VTFGERDARAVALIRENLALCGIGGGYTMAPGALEVALREMPSADFDVVLLDPPYGDDAATMLEAVWDHLTPDGLLVLERASRAEPNVPAGLRRTRDLRAGKSTLTFMRRA